jgi:demethylspheroidene O-methyltransferase
MRDDQDEKPLSSNGVRESKFGLTSIILKLYRLQTSIQLSPRFVTMALRFWPTRRIAQHQAVELFDLVSGFVYSQILRLAVDINLLDHLVQPKNVTAISQCIGLSTEHSARVLRATTAIQLTKALPSGNYGLGKMGLAVLSNPGLVELIKHHDMLYRDLIDPKTLFDADQQRALGDYWSYARSTEPDQPDNTNATEVRAYSDLMAASQTMISDQVLQAYRFERHKRVMDLGGGTGAFIRSIRHKHDTLSLALFDLPSVGEAVDEQQLKQLRIDQFKGDFFQDELPQGFDLITLVRIIHDHNDNAVRVLFQNVFDALPNQGTLLIAEPLANTPGAERMGDAYFNLYFLAMGKGEPRSYERLKTLLQECGFTAITRHTTTLPLVCSVISATAAKT